MKRDGREIGMGMCSIEIDMYTWEQERREKNTFWIS